MVMKSKRLSFTLAAILLPLSALADDLRPACMPPDTGPNARVGLLCMAEMPNSRSQCQDYLDELASIENRSHEQTLALAFGRAFASQVGDDVDAVAQAELAGRELLRPLVDAAPKDAMLLYAYSSFHHDHEEHYRTLLRRVLILLALERRFGSVTPLAGARTMPRGKSRCGICSSVITMRRVLGSSSLRV